MRYAWLVLALGLTGTVFGQNAKEPAMVRAAMKTPPRHWTTTDGKNVSVRFLTVDRSKVQLLLGDGQKTRIATVQIPLLSKQDREWVKEEAKHGAELKKKSAGKSTAK
jgi:hypothetical protein